MAVKINIEEDIITAYLSGEIDHHNAKMIRIEIDLAIERGSPTKLILDFSEVTFMDSSGIGLVMGRYRLMAPLGGKVIIANTSGYIRKIMKLAGIEKIATLQGVGKDENKGKNS